MAYVNVPKDLTVVKNKVAFGLTKRQLVCFGAAVVVGIPIYLLTHKALGNSVSVTIMMVAMLPLFFAGMYSKDGQPVEILARNFIRARFILPRVRPYKTRNFYPYLANLSGDKPPEGGKTHGASKRGSGGKRKTA